MNASTKRSPGRHSNCKTCDGRIYAPRRLLGPGYLGVWLHHREDDWVPDPHPAVPQDTDALTPEECQP